MIVNTSKAGAARRAVALWKSRRGSLRDPITFGLSDLRYLAHREKSLEDHIFIVPRVQGEIFFLESSHDACSSDWLKSALFPTQHLDSVSSQSEKNKKKLFFL